MAMLAAQTPFVISRRPGPNLLPHLRPGFAFCFSYPNGFSRSQSPLVACNDLPYGLDAKRLPRHVAVIVDGNRRWAQKRGLTLEAGYEAGREALFKIIWLSCTWRLTAFTAFLFSTENWNRPKAEVAFHLHSYEKTFLDQLESFMLYNVQARVIGDVSRLPRSFQDVITKMEETTRQNSGLKLSFAFNYGGRLDMIRACQQIANKVKQEVLEINNIYEEIIDRELWTSWLEDAQHPDLIIRTSGEERLSNFFLWQVAYSELAFVTANWPSFDEALYAQTLLSFRSRDRRFGIKKYSSS